MKIFIQIASYRDPELVPTIKDCIENSKHPENLIFGIARQFHSDDMFDDLSEYENDKRFKIINIPYEESLGVCWARNKVQQLYSGEEYTLQIDSHMRFTKDWDEQLITLIKDLQNKGYKKPLLTGYVPSYNPEYDPQERIQEPWRMVFDRFTPEGVVFFLPEVIPNWGSFDSPIPARFYSAHFAFTIGDFAKEVQHDPEFYFHGEEISISVRSFTHGYDLFHLHRVIIWHEYTRKNRVKQWDDDKKWYLKNDNSLSKNRKLLGIDNETLSEDIGIYGFGSERTIRDYEKYAGILFSKRSIQKYTMDKLYPPNPYDYVSEDMWEKSFMRVFKHCINLPLDKIPEGDYDFLAVIFHDKNNKEMFRKDVYVNEINHTHV